MKHTSTTEFHAPGKTKGQSYEYTKEDKYLAYYCITQWGAVADNAKLLILHYLPQFLIV